MLVYWRVVGTCCYIATWICLQDRNKHQGWIKQWNMVRDIGACSKVFRICLNHDMLEPVNPILVMYVCCIEFKKTKYSRNVGDKFIGSSQKASGPGLFTGNLL